ncbi:hypothetical protein [Bacillus sp. T33-2]|uniref:hypothetical protein n=1 Tax=Bacillus sp. T33-2 TaxID=2054168 RepID=UPI000C778E7D|nr:hypothetical protein [Bacillus sp. T33-2]PLR95115.1 hypothetical protein CVD19_15795 [Bacillus sp. T33-2]
MSPIQGLLKKDYRISRVMFLIWLAVVLICMALGLGLSAYWAQPVGTLPVFVLLVVAQFAFAPIMMLVMLNIEAKNQLWLYSPQPGYMLLLSKYAVILSYQVGIQLILSMYEAVSLFWFGRSAFEQLSVSVFLQMMGYINLLIILMGFFFTSWTTFLWTVFQYLKSSQRLRPFRWIVIVLIFIAYNLFETVIVKIAPVKKWISQYKIKMISDASLKYEEGKWSAFFESSEMPVIPIFYYIILAFILFYVSARLLERKVEV